MKTKALLLSALILAPSAGAAAVQSAATQEFRGQTNKALAAPAQDLRVSYGNAALSTTPAIFVKSNLPQALSDEELDEVKGEFVVLLPAAPAAAGPISAGAVAAGAAAVAAGAAVGSWLGNVLKSDSEAPKPAPQPTPNSDPSDFTKLRGGQGYKENDTGLTWKKDQLHKDHWDISDRKGEKVKEVDFNGNQIWPSGPKNKNK
ncbi:hypothetical protein [Deinococcus sp. 23YEL01]|uniref:hypothetical protein n=1 Tax=Deinococcus sp. 23YEL01 TaxID=2745871 RepID=UPI001E38A1A3|nr:hypothetical protein [Deinococcus sp. 23YEL01]MCD0169553.1 hypothetical protein [Deinococcus sp. 23YEL01]